MNDSKESQGNDELVFKGYGDQYFLSEILCEPASLNVSLIGEEGPHAGSKTRSWCQSSPSCREGMPGVNRLSCCCACSILSQVTRSEQRALTATSITFHRFPPKQCRQQPLSSA